MRNVSTTWSHCFMFVWSSQRTLNTRFLLPSAFHISLSHEEILLISAWGTWNSLGVKGVLSIIVTFNLTSSFPCKSCYWCNQIRRGIANFFLIFLCWADVAEQICWAAGIVTVTITLKKEGPDINTSKDLNNSGQPPSLKSISPGCSFFLFFLPYWFLAFSFELMNPILREFLHFAWCNAISFYGITFRSILSNIICSVCSGKIKWNHFLLPRILYNCMNSLISMARQIYPKVLWLQRGKGTHYTFCNGDLCIMMGKSTLITVLSL